MSKPILLGVKKKIVKPFPIIEIMGPMDIGKKNIADLLARRLYGKHIAFPVFNRTSATSIALYDKLIKNPKALEDNPHWWMHIYIANLYEQRKQLIEATLSMPVIVTNYLFSFRVWAKAVGIDMPHYYNGFTVDLPSPTSAYCLYGEEVDYPDNLKVGFSPHLSKKVDAGMKCVVDKRIHKVYIPEEKFKHISINRVIKGITDNIKRKYKIPVDESVLCLPNMYKER